VTVINPGSVGLSRDGDPRVSYAVLDDDTIELKRVEYAVDETVHAVAASNLDHTAKQMLADIYRGGAYLGRWLKNGTAGLKTSEGPPARGGVSAAVG
jgi:hypothetical protein